MKFGILFDDDEDDDDSDSSSKNSNFHLVSTCVPGRLLNSSPLLESLLKEELEELRDRFVLIQNMSF